MNGADPDRDVRRDLDALSERVARIEQRLNLTGQQGTWSSSKPQQGWAPPAVPPRPYVAPPRSQWLSTLRIDVTPSRMLALAGGLVLLLGVGFLLRYAVAQGWLGPEVRVVLALLGSGALAAVGRRLERSEATRAVGQICIATGAAGAYTAIVAAAVGYRMIPHGLGLLGAAAVAAAAAAKGVHARMQAVAALGVGGALIAPALLQTAPGLESLTFLIVTITATLAVAVRRDWPALAGLAFVLGWPQVWALSSPDAAPAVGLTVAAVVGALFLAAAVALGWRQGWDRTAAPGVLAALNAVSVSGLGWLILQDATPAVQQAPGLWVAAVAAVHLVIATLVSRRLAGSPIAVVVLVAGVVFTDVALLLLAEGYVVPAALGIVAFTASVAAVRLGWLRAGLRLALAVQLAVIVAHSLAVDVPRAGPGSGEALIFVAALSAAAAALGLLLRAVARDLAVAAAISYGGLALVRLITVEAPLESLLIGPASLPVTVAMCALITGAAIVLGQTLHRGFTVVAVAVANYAVSLAAVAMDPDGAGRVALTGLWAVAGGAAFIAGRHLQRTDLRRGGAALLGTAVAKAALVDTVTLDGTNRAVALLLCGAVLVATAVSEARNSALSEGVDEPVR